MMGNALPERALVLDGNSRAAAESVQAFGQAGIIVDVAARSAEDTPAFSSRYPARRLIQPPAIPPSDLIEALRQWDREAGGYRLIVPATESALSAMAGLDEADPLRVKAIIPANAALESALDKEQTHRLACDLGVPVPVSVIIAQGDHPQSPAAYPVVIKPARSKVRHDGALISLAPRVVRDARNWRLALDEFLPLTPVLQQEYVHGWGVGIEMLYEHGEARWVFAHERLHESPLTGGGSTYRRSLALNDVAPMIADARKLLDEIAWHGVAMVEFKRSAQGDHVLMEINPRLWGSLALGIDAGVSFPLGLWCIAGGEALGPQPEYRAGYRTRYVPGDLNWMLANLRANHHDPLLLTRSRFLSALEWLHPLLGGESWDHWDPRDLGILRHELAHWLRTRFHR